MDRVDPMAKQQMDTLSHNYLLGFTSHSYCGHSDNTKCLSDIFVNNLSCWADADYSLVHLFPWYWVRLFPRQDFFFFW